MGRTKVKKGNMKNLVILMIVICFILGVSLYISSAEVRDWFDIYILRKEIMEDELNTIDLNSSEKNYTYAYGKYVVTLKNNILSSYISSGYKTDELEVTITTPIFDSEGKYLCIGEKAGSKIYLISGDNIIWQRELEGEIFRIDVNKNGYVSVIVKGKNYQNIVYAIDKEGKELFQKYLSSTTALKAKISNDNSMLAIAEIDTSSTIIKTKVETISIEKAQKDPNNSIIYTYEGEGNYTIVDIEFQDKNQLICMYDDYIEILKDGQEEKIMDLSQNSIAADINLKDCIVEVEEETSKLFSADTKIFIKNIQNKKENTYVANNTLKKLYAKNDIIVANMGNEAVFINTNGRLIKKYISKQEIQDIVIGDSIVGIIYKNKIELFSI